MTQEFYALGRDRSAITVLAFLNHFLPQRDPCADDYPVPEGADVPTVILRNEPEILEYLAQHPSEPYGLYWNDAAAQSGAQAMVFYTRDAHVIFGLAEDAAEPARRLSELAAFVGATYSMIDSERRPPDTADAFMARCAE
jgi:hypothetical protein